MVRLWLPLQAWVFYLSQETIWVRIIPDFENSRSLSSVLLPIKLLPFFSPFWKCLLLWLLLSFQSYGLQSPHSPASFPITLQKTALWPLTPYTKPLRLNYSLTPWASPSLKPSHLLLFLTLYSLLTCCCLVPRSCLTLLWPHGQYVAHQLPLSMGFPGKNTGVGCHFLLWGSFTIQVSNPCLLHRRWILTAEPLGETYPWLSSVVSIGLSPSTCLPNTCDPPCHSLAEESIKCWLIIYAMTPNYLVVHPSLATSILGQVFNLLVNQLPMGRGSNYGT